MTGLILTDPNYPKYLAYYTLKGLTVYPDTPENRDYERLLRESDAQRLPASVWRRRRPRARWPPHRAPARRPRSGRQRCRMSRPTRRPSSRRPARRSRIRFCRCSWASCSLALLLLLALWYFLSSRPVPLRLNLGDKGLPRDYRLRPGAQIALGGAPGTATGSQDIFPLAGLAAPVAFVQADARRSDAVPPAAVGSPALFHNGLPLQQPAPCASGTSCG